MSTRWLQIYNSEQGSLFGLLHKVFSEVHWNFSWSGFSMFLSPDASLPKRLVFLQVHNFVARILIYVMNIQLDICYTMSNISHFIDASKQVLQYLKHTNNYNL